MAADDDTGAVGTAPSTGGTAVIEGAAYECYSAFVCVDAYRWSVSIDAVNNLSGVIIGLNELVLPTATYNAAPPGTYDVVHTLFAAADMLWITPTLNEVSDVGYPGLWSELLTVSAVRAATGGVTQASYTPTSSAIDIVAPGYQLETSSNRRYGAIVSTRDGTSFAAPIVAGVARLALQKYPAWTATTLRSELLAHARDLGTAGTDNIYGAGMVDAACVLQQISPCVPGSRVSPTALSVTLGGPTIVDGLSRVTSSVSGGLTPYGNVTWYLRGSCDVTFYPVGTGAYLDLETPEPGWPVYVYATTTGFGPEHATSAIKKVGSGFPIC